LQGRIGLEPFYAHYKTKFLREIFQALIRATYCPSLRVLVVLLRLSHAFRPSGISRLNIALIGKPG
jgi:hypothetical protein